MVSCVFTLFVAALVSSKANGINMDPIWEFDKSAALANWPERVMAGEWVVLVAATELLGGLGKVLVGTGVSGDVLSGIMGFYLTSSRLM